jgi:hypothetical protein
MEPTEDLSDGLAFVYEARGFEAKEVDESCSSSTLNAPKSLSKPEFVAGSKKVVPYRPDMEPDPERAASASSKRREGERDVD